MTGSVAIQIPMAVEVAFSGVVDLVRNGATCGEAELGAKCLVVYLRVYAGHMRSAQTLWNATLEKHERIGRLVRMYADRREELESVGAGEIVAVPGLEGVAIGDTLCKQTHSPLPMLPTCARQPKGGVCSFIMHFPHRAPVVKSMYGIG